MTSARRQDLFAKLASELHAMSQSIEALGVSLCGDPDFITRHVESLQELDRIAQMQAGIADIIAARDPIAACRNARLEHLGQMVTAQP